MINLLNETISYVAGTLLHNAPVLVFGILTAAAVKVYADQEKLRKVLIKKAGSFAEKYKLKELFKVFYEVGIKQVILYFAIFAAIGFLINRFVPAEVITKYLGTDNKFAVPLMALVGLPLFVSGSSSIPILNTLIAGGASQGALLAFMITGPGTSAGVIAGLAVIMKRKAIGLYIAYFLAFGILLGYLYDFLLMLVISPFPYHPQTAHYTVMRIPRRC